MVVTQTVVSQSADASSKSLAQQQFTLPRGLLGRLVGWFMARDNRYMNRMAIDCLGVQPSDDVLEIGFGPGHALKLLIKRTPARSISGIDPSEVMFDQAAQRNREAMDSGRLLLTLGSVDALPYADDQFDRVLAVSNFHVWPSLTGGLREVHRVLREDGRLVICLRRKLKSPWPWSSPGVSERRLQKDQVLLKRCGFRSVQSARRKFRRRLVCLIATK